MKKIMILFFKIVIVQNSYHGKVLNKCCSPNSSDHCLFFCIYLSSPIWGYYHRLSMRMKKISQIIFGSIIPFSAHKKRPKSLYPVHLCAMLTWLFSIQSLSKSASGKPCNYFIFFRLFWKTLAPYVQKSQRKEKYVLPNKIFQKYYF